MNAATQLPPLRYSAASHPGHRRTNNEDNFVARPDLGLFVVADGMGGHAAGDVASRMACKYITEHTAVTSTGLRGRELPMYIAEADREIRQYGYNHIGCSGMGTTVSALCIHPMTHRGDRAFDYAHVGDSAIFLVRGKTVLPVTEAESAGHHILLNCVGGNKGSFQGVEQHGYRVMNRGDILVLASDGLTDYFPSEVPEHLKPLADGAKSGIDKMADYLVDFALKAGGADNVTAVCVEVG